MLEISGGSIDCIVPDDLTIPQFFLDSHHPLRPARKTGIPWFVEDATGRPIGFEELRTRTFGLANGLTSRYGIKENDVVVLFSPNHVDWPPAVWATHRLGAIVSSVNPSYTTDELLYQIQATNATLIITHSESLSTAVSAARLAGIPKSRIAVFDSVRGSTDIATHMTVEALIQEGLGMDQCFVERKLKPGEARSKVAFLQFSSGTTGKPKAVAIPHYAPIVNIIQMALHHKINQGAFTWEDQRFRPGDVAAGILPFYHIYGLLVSVHFLIFCGVTLVVVPRFSFKDFLQSISRHKITVLLLVPPQIVLLCKLPEVKKYDLSGIRYMICGGASLSAELMAQVSKVLPNAQIGQGYGMTETASAIAMFSTKSRIGVPGSSGRLIPGVVARVVKADGTPAGFNEPGELQVKVPSIALGYWNDEKATKEAFVDGWLRTGDEVSINEDKEVFIMDRLKEMIKVKGNQVAPTEVEGCLLSMPEITDACVVPVPDDYSGEVPMAFVVLHPRISRRVADDLDEADKVKAAIRKFVADHKVGYKHLAGGVAFVDAIPKNPSGKLLRRVLRDRAREMRVKSKAKL